ncbi:MAG: cysteine hydrolase family protein [Bacteroidia bacterium]|jgi:nicotinamidase-related amidase
MTISIKDKPALILIDIQKGFEDLNYWGGQRNNPDAEINAGKLLAFWRKMKLPVFHARHCSSNPNSRLAEGQPGNEFIDIVTPSEGETVIRKNVNSAFIGTNLKELLDSDQIKILIIAGLTTDHCVSTTVRMAGNFGFDTFLVEDATATFCKKGKNGQLFSAEIIHETAIASLMDEFASIVKTEELLSLLNDLK